MSILSSLNLAAQDLIHGMGIRFWFQVMETQNIRNIEQCQLIIRSLKDFVNVFNTESFKGEFTCNSQINYKQDQSDIEELVIVLVLGIKFWQNTVENQNINDLQQCSVVISYLQKFISSMKVEDNDNDHVGEKIEIQQDLLDTIIKSEDTLSLGDENDIHLINNGIEEGDKIYESDTGNDLETYFNEYEIDDGNSSEVPETETVITPKILKRNGHEEVDKKKMVEKRIENEIEEGVDVKEKKRKNLKNEKEEISEIEEAILISPAKKRASSLDNNGKYTKDGKGPAKCDYCDEIF